MKTLLTDFPETAHKELARITALIRDVADPEFIVLFGRYAGTRMQNVHGGYELLVITAQEPLLLPQQLLRRVETAFPHAQRQERFLFLHTLSMPFVSGHLSQSLFLRTVLEEGVLLYDSRRFRYFRIHDFKPTQTYKKACGGFNLWIGQGKAHLHTAQWTLEQGYSRLAAANLYQAALAFLRAAELVCYGYQNPHTDIKALFVLTARFSPELSELFGFPDRFDRKVFHRLEAFRRNASQSVNFALHADVYHHLLEKVERMEGLVADLCGGWLERLHSIRYATTEPAKATETATIPRPAPVEPSEQGQNGNGSDAAEPESHPAREEHSV